MPHTKIPKRLRLGINVDHIATIRNARGGDHPCPVAGAQLVKEAGADGVTAHLREDRRHIRDEDIYRIKNEVSLPLNLEMAATEEMVNIALDVKPNAVCIVPEKRDELTTEGGLDIAKNASYLKEIIPELHKEHIRVSLFVDANKGRLDDAKEVGADIVELHTGPYCTNQPGDVQEQELANIIGAARYSDKLELECHAGHGLNYDKVKQIASFPEIVELNIGHFIIGKSVFFGLEEAIRRMRVVMDEYR